MGTKHYIAWKRYEASHGIGEYSSPDRPKIPNFVLDRLADEKLSGGFVTKRRNKCPECNTFRSVNGSCLCE